MKSSLFAFTFLARPASSLLLGSVLVQGGFAQGFGPQRVISSAWEARCVFAADLDGDADSDVLSAGKYEIAWYENLHGLGTFGPPRSISTAVNDASAVHAADLDGDGDFDVLSASSVDDKVAWYENTDGLGNFGPQRIISTTAQTARSVFAADLDGDGDRDVLSASWNDDKVAWYENTDGLGAFGPERILTTAAKWATSVVAGDLDGDGDRDAVWASGFSNGGEVAWQRNADGQGTFGPVQSIAKALGPVEAAFAADLDGDGDQDVLACLDYQVAWFENADGLGAFGPPQVLTTAAFGARSVFAADLDGDGDRDAVSASSDAVKIAWYENTDGAGDFGPQQTLSTTEVGVVSVFAADMDGDGDRDVLSASFGDGTIAWYENLHLAVPPPKLFGPQQVISTDAKSAEDVYAADVDGDGDLDVLSASRSDDKLAWYENTGGLGSFGPQQIITTAADGPYAVVAADLDGDGDPDVVSGGLGGGVAWYENTDGAGAFGPAQVLVTGPDSVFSVCAADLDGDGDRDVLSASSHSSAEKVAWYENTDGLGTFGPQQVITTAVSGARSVCAADLDGDGDRDVLAASIGAPELAWYENAGGSGAFGPAQVIATTLSGANTAVASDLDGDGDQDVLACDSVDAIAWFENADGLGAFGSEQVITAAAAGPSSVCVADVDGDGDRDVLAASSLPSRVAWYQNTDGAGAFGPEHVLSTAVAHPTAVFAADLEGDGDQDVLSASWSDDKIAWYENLATIWAVIAPYGCGVNPAGSLTVQSGSAELGGTLTLGVDNPLGTQSAPAASFVAASMTPNPLFPCGWTVPGLGMAGPGADGELLVDVVPGSPLIVVPGPFWGGPGVPVPFSFAIPADLDLLGVEVYLQGLLWDQALGASVPYGLTTGIAVRFGT